MELCRWCAWAGENCSNSCLLAGARTKLDKEARSPRCFISFSFFTPCRRCQRFPCDSNQQSINHLRHRRPAARLPDTSVRVRNSLVANSVLDKQFTSRVSSIAQLLPRPHNPLARRYAPSLSSIIIWLPFNRHTTCLPPHP
jgi:hypothetical protein